MPFPINRAWVEFMETPIAALQEYGMELRTINKLEEHFGIYIKDLHAVQPDDLDRAMQFGMVQKERVQLTLRKCYADLEEKYRGI